MAKHKGKKSKKNKLRKKCLVMDCGNHTGEGRFVGKLCYPCHEAITTGVVHPLSVTFIGALARDQRKLRELTAAFKAVCTRAGLLYP